MSILSLASQTSCFMDTDMVSTDRIPFTIYYLLHNRPKPLIVTGSQYPVRICTSEIVILNIIY